MQLDRLKRDLIEQKISERLAFPYFLVILIFDGVLINHSFAFPSGDTANDAMSYLQVILPVTILVAATLLLYKANGGSKGEGFYVRYFPLVWVIGVRFTPLAIAAFSAWLYFVANDDDYSFGWREVAFWNGFYILYYWRVWVHISDVRQQATRFKDSNQENT